MPEPSREPIRMPQIIRAAAPLARIVKADVWDARKHAKAILAKAEQEAERLGASARAEAASVRADALAQARQVAHAEAAHLLMEAQRIFNSALETAEGELVNLAVLAAERIVYDELRIAPTHITAIVREALRRVRDARRLRVFVHPDDKATLEPRGGDLHLERRVAEQFAIIEDPTLSRGSCVISTELGEIDARIETRLELIRQSMHR